MLAKLLIRHPRIALFVFLEGQRVDQRRMPVIELNVVRAGVLQRHLKPDRSNLNVQRDEGRIA